MKASDLRIGNYVLDRGKPVSLKVSQLVNIITGKYVDEYQPIPLTEEILLKCQSKFYFLNFEVKKIGEQCSLFYCNVFVKDVNYLHEYQNAHHALTGEELTVNL